jgi:GT2 family glycosyltransferase
MPKVAVVILNWNGKKFLEKFLPSVLSTLPNYAKLYVADNASTDDSIALLKETFPTIKLVENPDNEGYAKGYNDALERIKADYYILLNSDVEVTKNWIEPIIDIMERDDQIAVCQPKLRDYNLRDKFEYAGAGGGFIDKYGYPFCRGRIFQKVEYDEMQYNETADVFWASGACMFVRSNTFWELEGFDPDFFAHMEEIDFCWRAKNKGYRIVCVPQSTVFHVGGGTLPSNSSFKTFLNFRNNLFLLFKNLETKRFYLFSFGDLYSMELQPLNFLWMVRPCMRWQFQEHI